MTFETLLVCLLAIALVWLVAIQLMLVKIQKHLDSLERFLEFFQS